MRFGLKEIKLGSLTSNLRRFELSDYDISIIRQMYLDQLQQNGLDLGPHVWFHVIVRFLESQNYSIKREDKNGK